MKSVFLHNACSQKASSTESVVTMDNSVCSQEELYDEFSGTSGDAKDVLLNAVLEKMCKAANNNLRILDVGCGDGHVLEPFAQKNEVHGIDVSKNLLRIAQERGIKTQALNLEEEPFPYNSNYFDTAICSETIEHLITPDNMLSEINRVLKPNGKLILTFPNVNQPISLLIQSIFDLPPMYSAHYKCPHYRDYTRRVVEWLIRSFGFKILSVNGTFVYPFKNALSQRIAHSFPRLGEKILIVASKTSAPDPGLHKVSVFWSQTEFLKPHFSTPTK